MDDLTALVEAGPAAEEEAMLAGLLKEKDSLLRERDTQVRLARLSALQRCGADQPGQGQGRPAAQRTWAPRARTAGRGAPPAAGSLGQPACSALMITSCCPLSLQQDPSCWSSDCRCS